MSIAGDGSIAVMAHWWRKRTLIWPDYLGL